MVLPSSIRGKAAFPKARRLSQAEKRYVACSSRQMSPPIPLVALVRRAASSSVRLAPCTSSRGTLSIAATHHVVEFRLALRRTRPTCASCIGGYVRIRIANGTFRHRRQFFSREVNVRCGAAVVPVTQTGCGRLRQFAVQFPASASGKCRPMPMARGSYLVTLFEFRAFLAPRENRN